MKKILICEFFEECLKYGGWRFMLPPEFQRLIICHYFSINRAPNKKIQIWLYLADD